MDCVSTEQINCKESDDRRENDLRKGGPDSMNDLNQIDLPYDTGRLRYGSRILLYLWICNPLIRGLLKALALDLRILRILNIHTGSEKVFSAAGFRTATHNII